MSELPDFQKPCVYCGKGIHKTHINNMCRLCDRIHYTLKHFVKFEKGMTFVMKTIKKQIVKGESQDRVHIVRQAIGTMVACDTCNKSFKKKNLAHRFCKLKCKDRYHNVHNPRGEFAYLNPSRPEYDPQRAAEESRHPFDLDD